MVPVDELFSRLPRVVRDLADRSGKEIELRIIGQETRLDRTIVERLQDPMIHLIRNAVDHALETPEERLGRGKSQRDALSAGHEGDRVAIRVEDDGRGLDRERIVRKGIALGMVPIGTPADDPRVVTLIFEPGFSTRGDTVSDLSGRQGGSRRGARRRAGPAGEPGRREQPQDRHVVHLPPAALTLALIDGLLVETGGAGTWCRWRRWRSASRHERGEAGSLARPPVRFGAGQGSSRWCRPQAVPLRWRGAGPAGALLTRHADQRVGVAVDKLLGRVQAVIQALGEGLSGLEQFSGRASTSSATGRSP
ncbi:MAG: ATP-binding protein [Isosphaeraceae bacterium]